MLTHRVVWLALTAMLAVAATASASVQLTIRDNRVWLTADHATIAEILTEWSRVGATQITNAQGVKGPPLTLDLRGVSELEALDVIMRSAGGFVAVSRTAGVDSTHLSQFSRLVIVAVARGGGTRGGNPPPLPAPAPPIPVQAPVMTESGARRLIGPDGQLVPDDQEDAPPPPVPPTVVPGGSMPPGSEPPAAPPRGAARPGMMPPVVPPRRPGGATSD